MISVFPSATFEVTFDNAPTGLVGTLGVRLLDGQGATTSVRTTTGIVEHPAGSGVYTATLTAPATAGQYTVVADTGGGTPLYASEQILVSGTLTTTTVGGPASAQTFLQLQDAALHDDFSATKYRNRTKVLINEALARLGRRVYSLQRHATATVTLVAGDATYPLPADFVRLVSLRDEALRPGALEEVDVATLDDLSITSSAPQAFAIDGLSLTLWPTPVIAGSLTLRYWATPATLINDGDVPAVPVDYVDLVVTYARARLFRLEDDMPMHDALMAQFDIGTQEARADLQRPSMTRRRQIPGASRSRAPRFVLP